MRFYKIFSTLFSKEHKTRSCLVAATLLISLSAVFFHCVLMPKQLFYSPTSTILLDEKGELLCARIAQDEQWRFPETDTLNQRFVTCLVNYEDRRFYHHLGVDPIAILRALKRNISNHKVMEGGSTLTMQLARMARSGQPRTLGNKLIEALWAIDIELTHNKEEILKLYVSHAPFGGNIVGVDAASWRYFHRSIDRLSWAELATLAVLPNSPSLINMGRNRQALQKKRDSLLKTLRDRKILTEEEYLLSIAETLPDAPYPLPNAAPHLMDYLSKTNSGKIIPTKIDSRLQRMLQNLADDYNVRYRTSNHIDNIAILVLNVATGEPTAYVGNTLCSGAEAAQVDIIQSERSPGSTLKPFLYAAMISCGEITPRQLISDTPLSINGFTPSNFSKTFQGAVHADDAIIQSLNVPLVRMLSTHTTGRFMEDLKWLGISTLRHNEDHYGASLILGGAEVKLWDLCQMYRKTAYRLQYNTKDDPKTRISRAAIWCAFEAMSKLNRPEEEAEWKQFRTMKNIAWKTGTSWGNRDAWSIGVSPEVVVGVWVGNATGEGRAGMTGVGFASPVMFDVFALLKDAGWFSAPYDEMKQMTICKHSGQLASPICAETYTTYLPTAAQNTLQCPYCRWVHLTNDEHWQVNTTCATISDMKTRSWFILPAAQEYYYKAHHSDYHPLPPYKDGCEGETTDQIALIYPEHNDIVVIPRGFDGKPEKVICKAVCRRINATLFWHLDQEYIGKTTDNHQMAINPPIGKHILSIVDEGGNQKTIQFNVQ